MGMSGHYSRRIVTSLLFAALFSLLPGPLQAGTGAAPLLGGDNFASQDPPPLPYNKEMIDSLSRMVQQLEQGAAGGLPQLAQIGTFNHWCFWMGWEGSFSDTYLPNSEAYDWVVYFAPEGVYLALQSSLSHYSGVDVFYGIGSFMGMLVSPDGDVVTKSYIGSLKGDTVTFNISPFSLVPFGPLANLGMAYGIGPTFFHKEGFDVHERAIQYGQSVSVSYSLIPISLPISVSLNYKSTFNNGFYPIITWNLESKPANPINAIVAGLNALAASPGTTVADKIAREVAQKLLPFLTRLKTAGPVTLKDNVKPVSAADYFGHFLQNNSLTVPAGSPNTSIDYLIKRADLWKQGGWSCQTVFQQINFPIDLPKLAQDLKVAKPATELAFETGYQLVYDMNPNDVSANCITHIPATPGKPVDIVVRANEIAALLPGALPADFEGVEVVFTNPPESYLSNQGTTASVFLENGQAVYRFTQASDTSFVIAVTIYACPATKNKKLILCRRILDFNSAAAKGLPFLLDLLLTD
jgi:hypothetical protein